MGFGKAGDFNILEGMAKAVRGMFFMALAEVGARAALRDVFRTVSATLSDTRTSVTEESRLRVGARTERDDIVVDRKQSARLREDFERVVGQSLSPPQSLASSAKSRMPGTAPAAAYRAARDFEGASALMEEEDENDESSDEEFTEAVLVSADEPSLSDELKPFSIDARVASALESLSITTVTDLLANVDQAATCLAFLNLSVADRRSLSLFLESRGLQPDETPEIWSVLSVEETRRSVESKSAGVVSMVPAVAVAAKAIQTTDAEADVMEVGATGSSGGLKEGAFVTLSGLKKDLNGLLGTLGQLNTDGTWDVVLKNRSLKVESKHIKLSRGYPDHLTWSTRCF